MTAASASKPAEVEGFFDTYFYTPMGGLFSRGLRSTAVTPNQVSWLSVAVAVGAAAAYFQPSAAGALTGAVLLLLSGVLDSADGQLARATGRTSELGETLDGFCDSLSFGAIYAAAALSLVVHGGGSILWVAAAGMAAAVSHSLQSSLVDFERQLFMHYVAGSDRVLREAPSLLQGEIDRAHAAGEAWWPQLLRRLRLSYCVRQRRWLPSSVALLALHQRQIGRDPERRRWFAELYRQRSKGVLQGWTLFAPNSHTGAILVFGAAPYLLPRLGVVHFGLALVFAFDLVLNLALPVLIAAQAGVDRGLSDAVLALEEPGPAQSLAFHPSVAR